MLADPSRSSKKSFDDGPGKVLEYVVSKLLLKLKVKPA